jgi:hypothetical protein
MRTLVLQIALSGAQELRPSPRFLWKIMRLLLLALFRKTKIEINDPC